MQKEIIEKLALENSNPCVTISLNTHRTKPDNKKDRILLKNLCKLAENRLVAEFGIKLIAPLLMKLDKVSDEIDISLNLDSLHIFLSNKTKKIIKSSWPIKSNTVHIANSFALRPLIYALNRTEEYLILLLSHVGKENDFLYIFNTSQGDPLYFDESKSVNVTTLVKTKLKIK